MTASRAQRRRGGRPVLRARLQLQHHLVGERLAHHHVHVDQRELPDSRVQLTQQVWRGVLGRSNDGVATWIVATLLLPLLPVLTSLPALWRGEIVAAHLAGLQPFALLVLLTRPLLQRFKVLRISTPTICTTQGTFSPQRSLSSWTVAMGLAPNHLAPWQTDAEVDVGTIFMFETATIPMVATFLWQKSGAVFALATPPEPC